jgi:hemoglobin
MVTAHVVYRISSEQSEAFQRAYTAAAKVLSGVSGCKGLSIQRCVEEPERWIVQIRWTSVNAHTSDFKASPVFADFLALVVPFKDNLQEMRHYEEPAVV